MNCRVPKIVAVSLLIASANSAIAQEDGFPQPTPSTLTSSDRPDAWKIENALSAGPKFIRIMRRSWIGEAGGSGPWIWMRRQQARKPDTPGNTPDVIR